MSSAESPPINMEELVDIIIAIISKWTAPPKQPTRQSPGQLQKQAQRGRPAMLASTTQTPSGHGGPAYKPIPGARAVPPSRAVLKGKTPQVRRARRPQPPPMIAAPIVTGRRVGSPPPAQGAKSRAAADKIADKTKPAAPTPKAPAALDAAAFRRWLTPATLRQQFMLTEIFQPPLALRTPPEIL
jgi:hypothetical protein